jgi:5-methyltetrahydrofolate--homocysteine methyltransferase
MENILKRLQRGEVIVGDGALGTMLMQRGLKHGDPPETYNLENPHILEEIASLYLEAGAEMITTNSFGASPLRLQQFSLENDTEAINQKAVEAVRRVVQDKAYVSGSVGPSSRFLKPLGDTEPEEVFSSYLRQIRSLLSAGVDLVCIETMMDVSEAGLAIQAARSIDSEIPIMATMTFGHTPQGFFTMMGASVKTATAELEKAGANIVGSNCGDGMENMVHIAREFRKYAQVPVAIQGNAGLPVTGGACLIYPESPEFVAGKAAELLAMGVQIIGGCCGTTPEHIRAIRRLVDSR